MENTKIQEVVTSEDKRTSSVELKQSAKGDWYVGTLKIYFDIDTQEDEQILERLGNLKSKVESLISSKNE